MFIRNRQGKVKNQCVAFGLVQPGRSRHIHMRTIAALLFIFMCGWAESQAVPGQPFSVKSSKGLRLKIYQDRDLAFIHAQLMIIYPDEKVNPAIPYLTMQNLFYGNLGVSSTELLDILERLGNDYVVEHRPDFFLLKINFLPDKIPLFLRFLKTLYQYKPFTDEGTGSFNQQKRDSIAEERFKDSIENYWRYFYNRKDWKSVIAQQLAYNHLFPGHLLGSTLVTPELIKGVALDHIRAFYVRSYRLENSVLVMKGSIDMPPLVFGLIEHTFGMFERAMPNIVMAGKLKINRESRVIIFNVESEESPTLFWYEAIPTASDRDPLQPLILNNILFGYPTGRIFANPQFANFSQSRLKTELINHHGVSVILNTVRLGYGDIEKFIMLVQRERRKLRIRSVDRQEYVNTLSSIYGRLKVNTQDFQNEVNLGIMDIEYKTNNATLAGFNQAVDNIDSDVIVVVGNARLIQSNLTVIKPKIIDFKLPH